MSLTTLSVTSPNYALSPNGPLRHLHPSSSNQNLHLKIQSLFQNSSPFHFSSSQTLVSYQSRKKKRSLICRAEFSQDAPFAIAIGACVFTSLAFPIRDTQDEGSDTSIDSTDARFAVMGIISFIPYFNWLSWVFAWLDTNRARYAVYSLVYLAPYLRTNLSLSPQESWLPIASIITCIIHIQLEASIRNGDLQGFQLFNEALKHLKGARSPQELPKKGRKNESSKLPSTKKQSRNEHGRGVRGEPADLHSEEDDDTEGRGKH